MPRTRFVADSGLTVRMSATLFVLGGLFVAVVVGLMFLVRGPFAVVIGLVGLGIAWYQWYNSDTLALRAMRAREVAPHEAPELHAIVDRLCALADPGSGLCHHRDHRPDLGRGARGGAGPRVVACRAPRRAGHDAGLLGRHRHG